MQDSIYVATASLEPSSEAIVCKVSFRLRICHVGDSTWSQSLGVWRVCKLNSAIMILCVVTRDHKGCSSLQHNVIRVLWPRGEGDHIVCVRGVCDLPSSSINDTLCVETSRTVCREETCVGPA